MRSHYCGEVTTDLLGQEVKLAGWVHRRRDHGGVIFVDLRDREGIIQVVIAPEQKNAFANAESIRSEFVIQVKGIVKKRPEGTINKNLRVLVSWRLGMFSGVCGAQEAPKRLTLAESVVMALRQSPQAHAARPPPPTARLGSRRWPGRSTARPAGAGRSSTLPAP